MLRLLDLLLLSLLRLLCCLFLEGKALGGLVEDGLLLRLIRLFMRLCFRRFFSRLLVRGRLFSFRLVGGKLFGLWLAAALCLRCRLLFIFRLRFRCSFRLSFRLRVCYRLRLRLSFRLKLCFRLRLACSLRLTATFCFRLVLHLGGFLGCLRIENGQTEVFVRSLLVNFELQLTSNRFQLLATHSSKVIKSI